VQDIVSGNKIAGCDAHSKINLVLLIQLLLCACISSARFSNAALHSSSTSNESRDLSGPSLADDHNHVDAVHKQNLCLKVGNGPVPQINPDVACQFPFRYKGGKHSPVQTFDTCASVKEAPPFNEQSPLFAQGKTGFWCPSVGQDAMVYEPYNRQLRLQWSWCNCTVENPPESCVIKDGVSSKELRAWQPSFTLGPPGSACVFPFTYKNKTYYNNECADVNPKDPKVFRRDGWCFSNVCVFNCLANNLLNNPEMRRSPQCNLALVRAHQRCLLPASKLQNDNVKCLF